MTTIEAGTDRVSLRIPPDRLAEIDRLWREHGFPNRTEFMIAAAVEYAGARRSETDERLDDHEERIELLERAYRLGAGGGF
jgi:metal-responsive CopG/Arc/MetJ family transcriptional regulator